MFVALKLLFSITSVIVCGTIHKILLKLQEKLKKSKTEGEFPLYANQEFDSFGAQAEAANEIAGAKHSSILNIASFSNAPPKNYLIFKENNQFKGTWFLLWFAGCYDQCGLHNNPNFFHVRTIHSAFFFSYLYYCSKDKLFSFRKQDKLFTVKV